MSKKILLSFDVEEFDIPEEYGQKLEDKVKFEVSLQGLQAVIDLLDQLDVQATFFTTANFALNHKSTIIEIAKSHEIASHGFYHSDFNTADLKRSRQVLEQLIGKQVLGFRMPRLQKIADREIEASGYQYNSSTNPTYIPGRYNNFFKPRTAYYSNRLLNIPVSVTPVVRFPLFWLSFKNFPLWWIKLNSKLTLANDNYLNLYFHPWEFTDISKFQLPSYIKRRSGREMTQRLKNYIVWLKAQGTFIRYSEYKTNFR